MALVTEEASLIETLVEKIIDEYIQSPDEHLCFKGVVIELSKRFLESIDKETFEHLKSSGYDIPNTISDILSRDTTLACEELSPEDIYLLQHFSNGYSRMETASRLGLNLDSLHSLHKQLGKKFGTMKIIDLIRYNYRFNIVPMDDTPQTDLFSKMLDYHKQKNNGLDFFKYAQSTLELPDRKIKYLYLFTNGFSAKDIAEMYAPIKNGNCSEKSISVCTVKGSLYEHIFPIIFRTTDETINCLGIFNDKLQLTALVNHLGGFRLTEEFMDFMLENTTQNGKEILGHYLRTTGYLFSR
ncbi:hypothetical protein JXC34_02840 [Candidatus Woesearchaeota archaeon]|nr:hypothetical protein [Candidatus Woesearchaeota archaeon]